MDRDTKIVIVLLVLMCIVGLLMLLFPQIQPTGSEPVSPVGGGGTVVGYITLYSPKPTEKNYPQSPILQQLPQYYLLHKKLTVVVMMLDHLTGIPGNITILLR